MSESRQVWQCSNCGKKFDSREYDDLSRKPVNPEAEDPRQEGGYEKVCNDCGAGIHTGKWKLRETVDTEDGEFTVSTVGLPLAHGLDNDQWFETLIYHPWGDYISDRYETKEEAREGHETRVSQIRGGDYGKKPVSWQLVLGEDE